jgi:hypothetical protein
MGKFFRELHGTLFSACFHMDKANKPLRDISLIDKLKAELRDLDLEVVDVDGKQMKPSQCYRIEMNPLHVMFNTNCPETLQGKINSILAKYLQSDETGSSQ